MNESVPFEPRWIPDGFHALGGSMGRVEGLPKTTPPVHEPLSRQLAQVRTLHNLGDNEEADILEINPDVMEIAARSL